MVKVTDIQVQKKNPGRVSIFIDSQFAFGISAEIRFDERLEIGQEISDEKIRELVGKDQVERLVNKSLRFLSFRPRSEKELRDHLLRGSKPTEIKSEIEKAAWQQSIEKVIAKLRQFGQVDDAAFATWWVEQRLKFKPMGLTLLRRELLAKGVGKEVIEEVMEGTPLRPSTSAQGFAGQANEEDLAMRAAAKKISSYKNLEPKDFRIKMGQFLARKGFGWEVIKKVVDSLIEKRVE